MGGWSHRVWRCPYYARDEKRTVRCYPGKITFPSAKTARWYVRTYCGSASGWQQCVMARAYGQVAEELETRSLGESE